MKERPLLFSAPMVRATLEERKTQTRRTRNLEAINRAPGDWAFDGMKKLMNSAGEQLCVCAFFRDLTDTLPGPAAITCPYGQPGDRLWVRETWTHDAESLDDARSKHEDAMSTSPVYYRATLEKDLVGTLRWRPSIHMPRWASRLSLEVTGVRVERLQDITEEDAKAEGLVQLNASGRYVVDRGDQYFGLADHDPRAVFRNLWESINGAGSWDTNPWVWAINFKKKEQS